MTFDSCVAPKIASRFVMPNIAINALSLRKGGGLQVAASLLSRFSEQNNYRVLYSDLASREFLDRVVGDRRHISFVDPLGHSNNAAIFAWGLLRQAKWLRDHDIQCVLGINHHFPSGRVPQLIYHLNVLRFDRPRHALWHKGEVADRLRDWRADVALHRATANIFESNMLLEKARQRSPNVANASVVYIGVDERRVRPSSDELSGDDRFALLAVTSGAPHKDNETLIRMLARLVALRPEAPWRLRIAGGSGASSFAGLIALARRYDVAARLEFLGFLPHHELSQIGSHSLCLVSASRFESFCMVALEAMSYGCPVVVADISSMPESVGDAGLLALPGDEDDFAQRVLSLCDVQFRRSLIDAGLSRARKWSWSVAAAAFENQFELAIAGAR